MKSDKNEFYIKTLEVVEIYIFVVDKFHLKFLGPW